MPVNVQSSIESFRDYFGAYHHHKEQMAYAAASLYLAGSTAVVFNAHDIMAVADRRPLVLVLLAATSGLAFLFVYWQLEKREIAAGIVEACNHLISAHQDMPANDPVAQTWRGVPLPKALTNKLTELDKDDGFLAEPKKARNITLGAMAIWTLAAAGACCLTSG